MFALLRTSSSINLSQLQADILGLLTGSITTAAGLSASCDIPNSSVVSVDPAGWSLYDSAVGTAKRSYSESHSSSLVR